MAAAYELAACAEALGLREDRIVVPLADEQVAARVAAATAMMAQRQGVARVTMAEDAAYERTLVAIRSAHRATRALCHEGIIPPSPQL